MEIPLVRILLVEDDEEDAAVFRRYASQVRHHSTVVTRARDAAEAMSLLADSRFDVVCLDLNLGGGSSGLDFLRQVCAQSAAPPIVIITGSGDEEKAAETMRCGAADYLVKDRLSPELLDRTMRTVLEKHVLEPERGQMMSRLAELSITDELTRLANRRHFMAKLTEELLRAERTGHLFALLMLDLDHFKEINDSCGHQAGDEVLRTCASTLLGAIRNTDFAARYGGDEFCVILPDASPDGAERTAEQLRTAIDALPDPAPTASVGVTFWQPRTSRDDILRNADLVLYEAKQLGRNRVVVHGLPPSPNLEAAFAK